MRPLTTLLALALCAPALAQEEGDPPAPQEKPREDEEEVVVVTASRLAEDPDEVGSSVSVVTASDLRRAQHRMVLDALREVPALDVVRTGPPGGDTSVFLRGANSEHTLVLIDGVEVNDPISPGRTFDFGHLTADNIERIEVIRGPQSVLYGSDAMGGVVNIITRRGEGDPRARYFAEAGSFGTYRGGVSLSGGTDLVNYSLGASSVRSGGISSADTDLPGNSERDGYRNSTVSARIGVTPHELVEIDVLVRASDARSEIDNFAGDFGDDPNRVLDTTQWLLKVEPRLTLFDGLWEQALGVSVTEIAREDDNPPDASHPGELLFSSFDSRILDLDWQHHLHLHEANTVTGGVEFEEDSGESFFHSDGGFGPFTSVFRRERARTRSGYLQDRLHLWDRFTATAGVRIDDHEEFGTHTTWRLTGAYFLESTGTKLRGTVGTGFKAPSLFQLFSTFGDPALEPEESLGWDAGVDQEIPGVPATASVTYFDTRFEELILFEGAISRYVNVGRADTRGLEAALRVEPVEDLELRLSYTVTETEDKSIDEELLRRPRHKGAARLLYAITEDWRVNVTALYVGERDDLDFSVFPARRIELDDYGLLHVATSYRIDETIEVFGRVENATDTHYEEVEGFGSPGAAGYIGASVSF